MSCKHVCDCSCHSEPGTMHMRACCFTCPECKLKIKAGRISRQEHETQCHSHTMVDEDDN